MIVSSKMDTTVALPRVKLIDSDGEPLETGWHVLQIALLLDLAATHFRGRDDYYAGGNMFIYYCLKQARKRFYRGPDFFFVNGVPRLPIRRYWCVWEEAGHYPDVIFELLSPSTAHADRTIKKSLYERTFKTHEYVCYDPEQQLIEAWRLGSRARYQAIKPDSHGRAWLEELKVSVGVWRGPFMGFEETWLRFFDSDGKLVPTADEAATQQAEAAAQQAEAAAQQAEAAAQQAAAAAQRLIAEEKRADQAEAQVRELQQRLAEQQRPQPKRGNGKRT